MDGDVGSIGYSTQHSTRGDGAVVGWSYVQSAKGREMMSSSAVDGENTELASTRGAGPRSEVGIVFSSTQLQVIRFGLHPATSSPQCRVPNHWQHCVRQNGEPHPNTRRHARHSRLAQLVRRHLWPRTTRGVRCSNGRCLWRRHQRSSCERNEVADYQVSRLSKTDKVVACNCSPWASILVWQLLSLRFIVQHLASTCV